MNEKEKETMLFSCWEHQKPSTYLTGCL